MTQAFYLYSAPPPCQAKHCSNSCQYGYQMDQNGCNTCTCNL